MRLRRDGSLEPPFCVLSTEMEKGLDKVTTGVVSYRKKKMSLRRYRVADKVSFITSSAVGSLGDAMVSL